MALMTYPQDSSPTATPPRHPEDYPGVMRWPDVLSEDLQKILAESQARGAQIHATALAQNTTRAYASHLRAYCQWVGYFARRPVTDFEPVGTTELFVLLTNMLHGVSAQTAQALQLTRPPPARVNPRTVLAWCAAIRRAYLTRGLPNPFAEPMLAFLLQDVRRGLRRSAEPPPKRARPMPLAVIEKIVQNCLDDNTLEGLRDAALLLVAFASGGRRRSELAGLQVEQVEAVPLSGEPAFLLTLTHLKGHAHMGHEVVPVLHEAARVLASWLHAAGLAPGTGPVFRQIRGNRVHPTKGLNGLAIWRLVKRRALQAGYTKADFSPHSLRAAFLTECGLRQIPLDQAAHLSKHSDLDTARGYQQLGAHLTNPAAQLTRGLHLEIPALPAPEVLASKVAYNAPMTLLTIKNPPA